MPVAVMHPRYLEISRKHFRNHSDIGIPPSEAPAQTPKAKRSRMEFFYSLTNLKKQDKSMSFNSLGEFLKKKSHVLLFREFLKKEFSEENLDFWLDIENYRKQKSRKQIKLAQNLHSTFIAVGALREINIDAATREQTTTNLQSPDSSTFDDAQVRVFTLMEKDSFRRFLLQEMATYDVNGAKPQNKTTTEGSSKEKKGRKSPVGQGKFETPRTALTLNSFFSTSIIERRKRKFSF